MPGLGKGEHIIKALLAKACGDALLQAVSRGSAADESDESGGSGGNHGSGPSASAALEAAVDASLLGMCVRVFVGACAPRAQPRAPRANVAAHRAATRWGRLGPHVRPVRQQARHAGVLAVVATPGPADVRTVQVLWIHTTPSMIVGYHACGASSGPTVRISRASSLSLATEHRVLGGAVVRCPTDAAPPPKRPRP